MEVASAAYVKDEHPEPHVPRSAHWEQLEDWTQRIFRDWAKNSAHGLTYFFLAIIDLIKMALQP